MRLQSTGPACFFYGHFSAIDKRKARDYASKAGREILGLSIR